MIVGDRGWLWVIVGNRALWVIVGGCGWVCVRGWLWVVVGDFGWLWVVMGDCASFPV